MSKENNLLNCTAVILAAGKGTRMKSELPKVATRLLGKPIILHVVENLYNAGLRRFCFIVGYKKEVVKEIVREFKDIEIQFALQEEQKGTAHAFLCACDSLAGYRGSVLVASGDMPALQPDSFRRLIETHQKEGNQATVLSALLDNPFSYGRLIRDESGQLEKIVEQKDGSAQELLVKEINTGTYVFEAPGVFSDLKNIKSDNAQNEYYLPDMITLYRSRGLPVGTLRLARSDEARGVNSPEELEELSESIKKLAV